MINSFQNFSKWLFANLDLAEEVLEKKKKAVIVIAGASSSGKSFSAIALKKLLNKHNHRSIIISLDQYNFGLSSIIPDKVNKNFFNNSLTNISKIKKIIKPILLKYSFQDKYSPKCLDEIKNEISSLTSNDELEIFIDGLAKEFAILNFDEPSVYDLKEAANDVKEILKNKSVSKKKYSKIVSERVATSTKIDGKNYDVIIIEGIYALNNLFLDELQNEPLITNFIDGDAKSLFLRRIIRDKTATSADTPFTTHIYFHYIVPSYKTTILPMRKNADLILDNNMSFEELRNGELFITKDGFIISNDKAIQYIYSQSKIVSKHYEKDYYFVAENEDKNSNYILRFRLRSKDEGKNYEPGSLVYKGTPKIRKDNKIIRPINVLLDENEIKQVWKDEKSCLDDFKNADFLIEKVETKIKSKICYKNQNLTIFEVQGKGSYLEIVPPINQNVIDEIKNIIK